jgi:hypothetical protein
MASIKILDTGYISATTVLGSQTQLTAANRAGYTGSTVQAFTLKTTSLDLGGGVNLEDKPIINKLTDSNVSLISVNNYVITVSCIYNKNSTDGFQYNELYQLSRLERTHGVKLLYPSSTDTILLTLVALIGEPNMGASPFSSASPSDANGTVSSTTPYLKGKIKNFRATDSSDSNQMRLSFDFEVTG